MKERKAEIEAGKKKRHSCVCTFFLRRREGGMRIEGEIRGGRRGKERVRRKEERVRTRFHDKQGSRGVGWTKGEKKKRKKETKGKQLDAVH